MKRNSVIRSLCKWSWAAFAGLFSLGLAHVVMSAPAQEPLFLAQPVRPIMMLNMSRDHQLFFKLYDDYSNITDGRRTIDGQPNPNYGGAPDAEAIRGLSDACMVLGIPVTGGNVSLYNQTGTTPIHPSPVVAVLGKLDDVARRTPSGWREDGQAIYLLGTTAAELDGSEWANMRGHLGGQPPKVDLETERALGEILINASRDGMIDSAHDLSEGGLAAALVESSLRYGVGARIALQDILDRDGVDLFTALFSETQGRAVVGVPRSEEVRFKDMCTARGFAHTRIGVVDAASGTLEINGVESLSLDALREAHEGTLPKYFG